MKTNKYAAAWESFFSSNEVLSKIQDVGFFDVTASELKNFTNEEPRLLTKWDSKDSVPEVFSRHKLGILSISRKSYRIAPFNLFHSLEFDKCGPIRSCEVPPWVRTLQPEFPKQSENIVLSACYASDVFRLVFGEEELLPAIYGRLSSNKLSFFVDDTSGGLKTIRCDTEPVQFEIDGSYESPTFMGVVEAKAKRLSEFNIRQLYIPWRFLSDVTGKQVRPCFLMFFNDIVHVFEYRFSDRMHFNSIELIDASRFSFSPTDINRREIEDIISNTKVRSCKGSIFPQANDFNSVIDICERLFSEPSDGISLADSLEYVSRQGYYYGDAACFLGIAEKKRGGTYLLTSKGKTIFSLPYKRRMLSLVALILSSAPFKKCMEYVFAHGEYPDDNTIATWIVQSGATISGSTPLRRAGTVKSWIRWIFDLADS